MIVVSPEDDAEVRRVSIANSGRCAARDRAHLLCRARAGAAGCRCRASGLLQAVRADRVSSPRPARCWRRAGAARPRSPRSGPPISPWSRARRSASCSSRPTGRASSAAAAALRTPRSMIDGRALSNTAGTVLDPVFACAAASLHPAGQRRSRVAFWTVVAPTRARSPRSGRQASRPHRLRPRGDPGLDPGAGAAAPSRHRGRRGPCLPAPRQSRPLCRSDACGRRRTRSQRGRRPVGPVAARHLRRPADRAAADRRGRGHGHRPPAAARP